MTFTAIERRWARGILGAIFPRGADPRLRIGVEDLALDEFLTDLAQSYPPLSLIGVRFALVLVTLAPLWLLRGFRTFGALAPAQQQLVLDRLYASNVYLVRGMVLLLKTVGGMCYAGDRAIRGALLLPSNAAPTPAVARPLVQLRSHVHAAPLAVAP